MYFCAATMTLSIKFEGSKALSNQNLLTLVGNAGHWSAEFPLLSHKDYVVFSPKIQGGHDADWTAKKTINKPGQKLSSTLQQSSFPSHLLCLNSWSTPFGVRIWRPITSLRRATAVPIQMHPTNEPFFYLFLEAAPLLNLVASHILGLIARPKRRNK